MGWGLCRAPLGSAPYKKLFNIIIAASPSLHHLISSAGIEKGSNSPSSVKSHPEDRTVKIFSLDRLSAITQRGSCSTTTNFKRQCNKTQKTQRYSLLKSAINFNKRVVFGSAQSPPTHPN